MFLSDGTLRYHGMPTSLLMSKLRISLTIHPSIHVICVRVFAGGVVDTTHQPLTLLLMAVSPEDICKVQLFYLFVSRIARDTF